MQGTVDPFDFVLAETLGMTLAAIRSLPNSEVVEFRQWFEYRTAMQELEAKKARRRHG